MDNRIVERRRGEETRRERDGERGQRREEREEQVAEKEWGKEVERREVEGEGEK